MKTSESLVKSYHRKNIPKWDKARVERLCVYLEITVDELASLLLIAPKSMRKYMESTKFSGPAKLWLTQLERLFLRGASHDVAEGKVMPLHLFALQDRRDCPVCGREL